MVPVFDSGSNKPADEVWSTELHHGRQYTVFSGFNAREQLGEASHDPNADLPHPAIGDGSDASLPGKDNVSEIRLNHLAGVLEVFSPLLNAFSPASQTVLEDFARQCAQIRSAASYLHSRPPAEILQPGDESDPADPEFIPPPSFALASPVAESVTQSYKVWTLALAAIVFLAVLGFSFLIGSRVGWLRSSQPAASAQPVAPVVVEPSPAVPKPSLPIARSEPPAHKPAAQPAATKPAANPAPNSNELVVYQKGKVIFRMPSRPRRQERSAI